MSNADTNISALRTGHDSLAALVAKLSDDDLARPSGAAEWDISQVLSHLGSGAVIAWATVQAALDGEPNPGRDFNMTVWDRWNAMSRRERADGFLQSNRTLIEHMNQWIWILARICASTWASCPLPLMWPRRRACG